MGLPMWTQENRGRYDRSALRYPSDLTDDEWALAKPHIPRAKRGGNKRTVDVREVMNGLMYVLSTGCQWRAIPKDLPPRSTVHGYFDLWNYDGTLLRLHHALKARDIFTVLLNLLLRVLLVNLVAIVLQLVFMVFERFPEDANLLPGDLARPDRRDRWCGRCLDAARWWR